MDRFTVRYCSVYYGAGHRLQKTEEFALGGEKLSKLKQRACASLCLDPEAVELWRYDRAADTTGAEPLPGDIRVTDPAVQRLTTLLLQHKPLRLKVLCPDITSSVLRVELEETDSVRTLKAKACAAVGVLPSAVLLWDAYDADDLQLLEQQLGSSLADANIVQGQALLLELRKPRRREWQACKDTPGTAADLRQCVCCKAAGWVPNPNTPAACRACPRGWIAQQGELQCSQCQPGYSTLRQGSTVCDACAAGYEGPTCVPCEPGSYSARGPASTAAVGCLPCPLGSSSSKVAATLPDCKTADGQGITSLLATVTLLSPCNISLAAALLPVVEDAVADAAGNSSDAEYDVAAGGCTMRVRVAQPVPTCFVRKVASDAAKTVIYTVTWGSAAGAEYFRDAVVSGCFMYVLAVTTGDMPREGLSGSGTFTNAGSSTPPSDIYVAKVDLRDGSRVWSSQVPQAGQDEPRGKKMLHLHQATSDLYLVATNSLRPNVLTVIKITQQGSAAPSHAAVDVDMAMSTLALQKPQTTTFGKGVIVTGVVLTQQGALWITGQTQTAGGNLEGSLSRCVSFKKMHWICSDELSYGGRSLDSDQHGTCRM
ncbi:hypothetical protein OEZ86_001319 [Tetradesmus obliquus]|nr:hypothetical protein OEZ86_001319 [Tetradesmus obliquus]